MAKSDYVVLPGVGESVAVKNIDGVNHLDVMVEDKEKATNELLRRILLEMRIMNMHLASLTDLDLDDQDLSFDVDI